MPTRTGYGAPQLPHRPQHKPQPEQPNPSRRRTNPKGLCYEGIKTNDDRVYYVPFQLLQYAWEWHGALEEVRADLQELIDARLSVGLTPAGIARLTGGLRAVVGFGTDNRTDEVRRRYGMVLDIVNRYLPPRVAPLETWEHTKTMGHAQSSEHPGSRWRHDENGLSQAENE